MNAARHFEDRLDSLRKEAKRTRPVHGRGVDVAGGPIPKRLATLANQLSGHPFGRGKFRSTFSSAAPPAWLRSSLVRVRPSSSITMHVARAWPPLGAILSPILLIMDLGRPSFSSTCSAFSNSLAHVSRRVDPDHFWLLAVPAWLFAVYFHDAFAPPIYPLILARRVAHSRSLSPDLVSPPIPACSLARPPSRPGFSIAFSCRSILAPPGWAVPPPFSNWPVFRFSRFTGLVCWWPDRDHALDLARNGSPWRSRSRTARSQRRLAHSRR